ncbi:S8 family serine peptidase [Succinimonas amylolytica]|uniref:S8 family serine peptidase n=1 Tax=Succinimonas amylolytica TaxID=83769 RepID=UPI0003A75B12|nr:S8 family serine peptidase [Succinimonas amylolytica]
MFPRIVSRRLQAAVAIMAGLSLAACGGGSSKKGSSGDDDYIEIIDDNSGADTTLECDASQVEINDLRGNRVVLGIDAFTGARREVPLPFVKKIRSGGRYGRVYLGEDNVYVYSLDPAYAGNPAGVPALADTITWYDGDCRLHSRPVALYADPLLQESWHLLSTGSQKGFRELVPSAQRGIDVNAPGAWQRGFSGAGATVAVVDTHVDSTHPDIRPQFRAEHVYSSYQKPHGTNVAGLIAGSCGNFEGGCGVAPASEIVSYEGYYDSIPRLTELFMNAFQDEPSVRVANGSWGALNPFFSGNAALQASLDMVADAGVLLVKSSGNGYEQFEQYSDCHEKGVSCFASVYDEPGVYPATVVVGAVSPTGSSTSYSTPGSSLLLAAPSGDDYYPALITANQDFSCSGEPGQELVYSLILKGKNPFQEISCYRYTNMFAGTSGAAPLVTGVAALALSANPDLTLWQLRHVLAESARNDTEISGMNGDEVVRDRGLTVNQGWIQNASGRRFSNRYGFGIPDAERAVDLALNCASDSGCRIRGADPLEFRSQTVSCQPLFADSYFASSYTCVFSGFNLDGADPDTSYEIESVVLDTGKTDFSADEYANNLDCAGVSFDFLSPTLENSFWALSRLQTEIKSPSHTLSVLKPLHAVFLGKSSGSGWRNMTNAFRGESFSGGDSFNVNIYSWCPLQMPVMRDASVAVTVFRK